MKTSRNWTFAAACALGAIGLSACTRPQPKATATPPSTASGTTAKSLASLTVGFAQIGAESEWRTAETRSVQSEAKKRGVNLKFADAQQKQENQIKAIHSFISQKVNAIILAPVVESGWEPVLREAKQAGIPIILADRSVNVTDPNLYVTLVSPDVVEEGRIAARWMAEELNGKGNIVELKGTTGSSPANDREKGFKEIIAKYPGIKVIMSQTGEFTRAKGQEVMEAFLKAPQGKQITGLYAHNDDMALGAIQAMEKAGIKPGTDIKIVSIDAVHGAFVAMVAGKLNCTVECNPLLGPAIFDALANHLAGKAVPKKVSLKERCYVQSEAKPVIGSRQY
jgi:galactofuranose transport system substrate-binding protein